MREKTIAAISTAQGQGGIGIIRISGDEARVVFRDAVKAPAPGQAAVFYDSEMRVMGGGTIAKDR